MKKDKEKRTCLYNILSHGEGQTESAGMLLASTLRTGDFVAMYGDLGVGKTAFVRGAARLIAPDSHVSSPTYTIVNEYGEGAGRLCHFDMYRTKDEDDLESIGFFDYDDCIVMAEWCENIPFALPKKRYEVRITRVSDTERMIRIDKVEA